MRLLCQRDEAFSLVQFLDPDKTPPYAILSHTWGPDGQEVTYQDITSGSGSRKDGWRKIRFCAKQAKTNGLEYFWVDSCCIDKSSSQELSEAIISMFKWYQRAQKCFVYLSDVSDDHPERRWKTTFRASRWFQRGWTLQELIAPSEVEFYSCEGSFLGSRSALQTTIHEITTIPFGALGGAPLCSFTQSDRFAWAASRETKRPEDAAYCLLGIFGVAMVNQYGEGRDAAFARLEEQIQRVPGSTTVSLNEEQRQKLMDSLRFDQIDARHLTIKTAHNRTCSWLLVNPAYVDWLDDTKLIHHHGFLWIKGKPGTGKSTLMKFAVANTRKAMRNHIVIGHFFNARGEELERSTLGTYRSLLLQLLEQLPSLQHVFSTLYLSPSSLHVEREWSIEFLESLLEHAILSLGKTPVICFIDALDECEEQQVRDMITFFERIGESATSAGVQFRVCLSSRHYPNITIRIGQSLVLEGQEGHTQDIALYLKSKLDIGKSKLADQIRCDVQEKASGVFMWVVLVVDILKQEYDRGRVHALRRRLREIPADLYSLFKDILTRDARNREELILCIQWVLFAKRPLSPTELYCAVLSGVEADAIAEWAFEPITEEAAKLFLLDSSKGLTEVTRSKSPKIQFIHESVRDFLLKENGLGSIWPELKTNFGGKSHERLKQSCYDYMSIDVEDRVLMPANTKTAMTQEIEKARAELMQNFPFLDYAVKGVLHHSDVAQGQGISQKEFVADFFCPTQLNRFIKFGNTFERHKIRRHWNSISPLYLWAEHDLSHLIRSHATPGACFKLEQIRDERYGTPLLAAIATGNTKAVTAFLDVVHRSEGQPYDSWRSYAQYYQKEDGGRLLGRDFNFTWYKSRSQHVLGHNLVGIGNWPLVALALTTGDIDSEMHDELDGGTLLSYAATRGKISIVRGLVDQQKLKIDFNVRDKTGSTVLMLALQCQTVEANVVEDVVNCLLSTGNIDICVRDSMGFTAYLLAVRHGHRNVVSTLLKHPDVDINESNTLDETALMIAAEFGCFATAKFLLDSSKVDVNARSKQGACALSKAADNGNSDIVRLLLETPEIVIDARIDSSLHAAARRGHDEVVKLLCATGKIDINTRDSFGSTALHEAVNRGRVKVVEVLLNTIQVDVDAKRTDGDVESALSLADENVYTETFESLLKAEQIDVNKKDQFGETPLMAAIRCGNIDNVLLLLATGRVDLSIRDDDGKTARQLAAELRLNEINNLLHQELYKARYSSVDYKEG